MRYFKHISPAGAASDLVVTWKENPYRWRVLAVSLLLTGGMLYVFLPENQRVEPRPPSITWITTFADGRSDAEILASNRENQMRQDELNALYEERAELRRELYRELGRATGLDVDEMEAKIRRDEAAAEAIKAANAARNQPVQDAAIAQQGAGER